LLQLVELGCEAGVELPVKRVLPFAGQEQNIVATRREPVGDRRRDAAQVLLELLEVLGVALGAYQVQVGSQTANFSITS